MRSAQLGCGHVQDIPESTNENGAVFCVKCASVRSFAMWHDIDMGEIPDNGSNPERSYGCSFGCGNPYDYVFVSVADGTTEFPCLPCFVKLAADIVAAVTSEPGAEMMAALADMQSVDNAPMNRPSRRKRGHEAPVNGDSQALIDAFDSRITTEELGDEFK